MILVATRQLPTGTIIGPDSFRYQPWPKDLVEQAYFLKDKTDVNTLVGTVVRFPITAGEPLTQGALVHHDDRGLKIDRTSVVSGKRVEVRVDIGGSRQLQIKNKKQYE